MNTVPISDGHDPLWGVFIRLIVEIIVLLIILPVIYRRFSGTKEHMFSFFLMGIMIFSVCILLKNVEIQMGMVLGLFAIFSIIRFRTINFSTKDMSYLFGVIGVSAINAMLDFPHPVRGTIIFNSIIIVTILLLEITLKDNEQTDEAKSGGNKKKKKGEKKKEKKKSQNSHLLIYDNLKLLNPDKESELISDISKRTGLKIEEIKIRKIDLTKGNAELELYCREKSRKHQEEIL